MLSENQVKEHLSLAFVHAIAARVGCAFQIKSVDMDSVDALLELRVTDPSVLFSTPQLELQLKATAQQLPVHDGHLGFDLPRKNHHDLVKRTLVPRLLVVLQLPPDPAQWLEASADGLLLRRCAYWMSIQGHAPTTNSHTHRLQIPCSNRFDVRSMNDLFLKVARHEALG